VINFGKYAVLDSPVYKFEKEPDWEWKVRPITTEDMLAYQRFHGKFQEVEKLPEWIEIAIEEIALCSESTNIPDSKLEKGGSTEQFRKLLMQMPPEMVGELWKFVGEVTPFLGPPRPQEPEEKKTEES
jgi:hypothetical protein